MLSFNGINMPLLSILTICKVGRDNQSESKSPDREGDFLTVFQDSLLWNPGQLVSVWSVLRLSLVGYFVVSSVMNL